MQVQQLTDRLDAKDDENMRLRSQLSSAQTILALDQQKYASLNNEFRQLQRSYQILQLAKQREAIQEEAKAARVQQTIAKHEQLLQARETQRQHHHDASIVLQSTIRSCFEQKRFQALKMHRANAVITLQCFARCQRARRLFRKIQAEDKLEKERYRAATTLQRFVHRQLQHKSRALLVLARQLSAVILQKYARRLIHVRVWRQQKQAVCAIQRWTRQRLAMQVCCRMRAALNCIRNTLRVWVCKRRWNKAQREVKRLQRWWRRVASYLAVLARRNTAACEVQRAWLRWYAKVRADREEIELERLEAALCIQALWRGTQGRRRVEEIQQCRVEEMQQVAAAVSIQSAWKQHKRREQKSLKPTRSEVLSESNFPEAPQVQSFRELERIEVSTSFSDDMLVSPSQMVTEDTDGGPSGTRADYGSYDSEQMVGQEAADECIAPQSENCQVGDGNADVHASDARDGMINVQTHEIDDVDRGDGVAEAHTEEVIDLSEEEAVRNPLTAVAIEESTGGAGRVCNDEVSVEDDGEKDDDKKSDVADDDDDSHGCGDSPATQAVAADADTREVLRGAITREDNSVSTLRQSESEVFDTLRSILDKVCESSQLKRDADGHCQSSLSEEDASVDEAVERVDPQESDVDGASARSGADLHDDPGRSSESGDHLHEHSNKSVLDTRSSPTRELGNTTPFEPTPESLKNTNEDIAGTTEAGDAEAAAQATETMVKHPLKTDETLKQDSDSGVSEAVRSVRADPTIIDSVAQDACPPRTQETKDTIRMASSDGVDTSHQVSVNWTPDDSSASLDPAEQVDGAPAHTREVSRVPEQTTEIAVFASATGESSSPTGLARVEPNEPRDFETSQPARPSSSQDDEEGSGKEIPPTTTHGPESRQIDTDTQSGQNSVAEDDTGVDGTRGGAKNLVSDERWSESLEGASIDVLTSPARSHETETGRDDSDSGDDAHSSSVDSTDLIWDVDAITSFGSNSPACSAHAPAVQPSSSRARRRSRASARMSSERILADSQLMAQQQSRDEVSSVPQ